MAASTTLETLDKFSTFGDLLRFLRRRAGLTQMELAIAVGYSDAQVSRLEQNLRQPDIPTVEARFPEALGIEDQPRVIARLLELAATVRREDGPGPGACPYKGLDYFDEADAEVFAGREAWSAKLAQRVLEMDLGEQASRERFLAVIGASGSGKSSLVRAGLVPAIRRSARPTPWVIHILTPTAHPLESLATSLTRASGSLAATAGLMDDMAREPRSLALLARRAMPAAGQAHLLLVVDQFEELFAVCRSEVERSAFVDNLLTAAGDADGPVEVVITLRADFYGHCAEYPALREALARQQEYIGAMSVEELRRAIEEPARRGGWEFEPGLVDLLLHDVGSEPGALPLLSHALWETWQRRRGHRLTLSGYAASGGVSGAIAETAEAVFTDQFTPEQRAIARRVFLRLTELSDDTAAADTRRRAAVAELVSGPADAGPTQAVLKALADARLIITGEDSAEVAHEALIREWPRLRGWLSENREGLRLHQNMAEAAHEWSAGGREPDALYRGARLVQVREWAQAHDDELNPQEREFLAASMALSEREAAEHEAQRQRELEAAQKLAQAERRRADEEARHAAQLRKQALFLAGAFVLALGMTLIALFFGTQARQAASEAQNERRSGLARELSAEAVSNLTVDPELSVLLAMEAISTTYSVDRTWPAQAEDALRRALLESRLERTLRGHADVVMAAAFAPPCAAGAAAVSPAAATESAQGACRNRLATASLDGTARIWDADTGLALLTLPTGATRGPGALSFSPDGTQLATAGQVGTALVWDASTGRLLRTLAGHGNWVDRVVFSADGKRIATASEDRTAKIWDAGSGQVLRTLRGHTAMVIGVAFSPDGRLVATGSADGTAVLWDAASGEVVRQLQPGLGTVYSLAFSPDASGTHLATAHGYNTVMVWNTSTGQPLLTLRGHTDEVWDVAFSPDAKRLASTGMDGRVLVWDATTGQQLLSLAGHVGPVFGVAFSPDCAPAGADTLAQECGTRLASTGADGTTRIWNTSFSYELLTAAFPQARAGAFSRDGMRLATGSADGTVEVWDLSGHGARPDPGKPLLTLSGHTGAVNGTAFSPDGARLATTSEDRSIIVWELATGARVQTLRGHTSPVLPVGWSPDGNRLVTASQDRTVRVWQIGAEQPLLTLKVPSWTVTVDFSPDGTRVAAGMIDGTALIWDAATGAELATLRGQGGQIWSVNFSPDGKRLAGASNDHTTTVWDVSSSRQLLTLTGHSGSVNYVAFSPDGQQIATAGQDGTVKLWDAASGTEQRTLYGHTDPVMGLAVSSDGARLLSASPGVLVRVYAVRIEDLMRLAGSRVTRGLTAQECRQYLHNAGACGDGGTGKPVAGVQASGGGALARPAAGPGAARGKVCEVTDNSGAHDAFFNQMGYDGVQEAARQFGWETALREPMRVADYEQDIAASIQEGCSMIVLPTGVNFGELLATVARANPSQKFFTVEWPHPNPPDNVWLERFASDQAAFLAGYVAAGVSKTGAVATYGGVRYDSVTLFMDGFALGVDYYNRANGSKVKLLGWNPAAQEGLFTGDFVDSAAGRRMAESLLDQGADVILPVAGATGIGTAAAVKERGNAYVIGVDTDWALEEEYADVVLTSVMKRVDVGVVSAVKAIVDGSFAGGPHDGTLENGGVDLAPFHHAEAAVPAKVRADLEQIRAGIIAGTIKTQP